ncbi:MAG: hypothetical protein QOG83_2254 [Alphaproteobacteria bacterium]|nr:hypothetical protein [Alphaproteobacteria bacterium]
MTGSASAASMVLVLAPVLLAALLSAALITVLAPWLKAYALARPNARSSHVEPTPQGGGAAVVVATLLAAWAGSAMSGVASDAAAHEFLIVSGAAALLAGVGAVDDIRGLPVWARLALQILAVGVVLAALPADTRLVPLLPWWVERAALLVAGVWAVNLTNFMDGIDWMTVAEVVPVTAAIALVGVLLGAVSELPTLAALALLGAILGFAPFNRPVARLFLGDVGSLPIGLLLFWLLLHLAARGHLAAALLLPLYYLTDATLTLLRRALAREPVWQAHRSHFYQRATNGGFTVSEITARVFATNVALAALSLATILASSPLVSGLSLPAGAALVGLLLRRFARGKR